MFALVQLVEHFRILLLGHAERNCLESLWVLGRRSCSLTFPGLAWV